MTRPLTNRFFGGVCAAFALHYGWRLGRVRLAAVLIAILTGCGIFAYLIAWFIIPAESYPSSIKSL